MLHGDTVFSNFQRQDEERSGRMKPEHWKMMARVFALETIKAIRRVPPSPCTEEVIGDSAPEHSAISSCWQAQKQYVRHPENAICQTTTYRWNTRDFIRELRRWRSWTAVRTRDAVADTLEG